MDNRGQLVHQELLVVQDLLDLLVNLARMEVPDPPGRWGPRDKRAHQVTRVTLANLVQ